MGKRQQERRRACRQTLQENSTRLMRRVEQLSRSVGMFVMRDGPTLVFWDAKTGERLGAYNFDVGLVVIGHSKAKVDWREALSMCSRSRRG